MTWLDPMQEEFQQRSMENEEVCSPPLIMHLPLNFYCVLRWAFWTHLRRQGQRDRVRDLHEILAWRVRHIALITLSAQIINRHWQQSPCLPTSVECFLPNRWGTQWCFRRWTQLGTLLPWNIDTQKVCKKSRKTRKVRIWLPSQCCNCWPFPKASEMYNLSRRMRFLVDLLHHWEGMKK